MVCLAYVLTSLVLSTTQTADSQAYGLYVRSAQAIDDRRLTDAVATLEQLIAAHPNTPYAHTATIHLAECLLALEQPLRARTVLLEISPTASEGSRFKRVAELLSEATHRQALKLEAQGDLLAACRMIQRSQMNELLRQETVRLHTKYVRQAEDRAAAEQLVASIPDVAIQAAIRFAWLEHSTDAEFGQGNGERSVHGQSTRLVQSPGNWTASQ